MSLSPSLSLHIYIYIYIISNAMCIICIIYIPRAQGSESDFAICLLLATPLRGFLVNRISTKD